MIRKNSHGVLTIPLFCVGCVQWGELEAQLVKQMLFA
jgi:hypothetical protein